MAKSDLEEIKKDLLQNLGELSAAFLIMSLVLFHVIARMWDVRSLSISAVACLSILLIGLEKRGSRFDRFTSMIVVFTLAISFLFM